MSSEISTEPARVERADAGLQPWHFYFLLSMAGATWAVVVSRHTQPAALVMLSAAILATGAVAAALHSALIALLGGGRSAAGAPMSGRLRADLERDKALVLRAIKELEFDHAMRKVSDADFAEIGGRLRARALGLIAQLEAAPAPVRAGGAAAVAAPAAVRTGAPVPAAAGAAAVGVSAPAVASAPAAVSANRECASCHSTNEPAARFCSQCGARLA